jgi:hypothetical protein
VVWGDADDDYRCNVCDEMVTEKRRSVTRIDGIVFMRRTVKKKTVISKYIVTKLGNLKEISSAEVDLTPTVTAEEEPFDEVTVEAPNKDDIGEGEKK